MEVGKKYFEQLIDKMKEEKGVTQDVELTAEDLNLFVAARIVPIEIEPDLAHGNETPVSSQHPLHLVEYGARIGREFCRMKPQHREAKSGISLTQSQHGRH